MLAAWFAMPDFQMLLEERAECAPAFARVSMLASLLPRLCDAVLALSAVELKAIGRRPARLPSWEARPVEAAICEALLSDIGSALADTRALLIIAPFPRLGRAGENSCDPHALRLAIPDLATEPAAPAQSVFRRPGNRFGYGQHPGVRTG